LAPDHPEGYLALGDYQRLVAADPSRALEQYLLGQRRGPGKANLTTAIAVAEEGLGRWQAAVDHLGQALQLDPRSILTARRLSAAFVYLRDYRRAGEAADRGLAIAPANLAMIETKAVNLLAQGDLTGARAVLKTAQGVVEPTALVAYFANYNDLVWVLEEPQRELLLRLTPSTFDDDRGTWAVCLAQAYALKGDAANLRIYSEEARKAFEEQLRATPQDAQRHVELGLVLAYLGRKDEAIREGERGLALVPVAKDAYGGPYNQHQLVRIYMLVGEPEKALDRLEPLLKIPHFLSPGWLKVDPNFDPLRNNPRFQKLIAAAN
jgi:tetratricopeptide (TPR) repeat protein